jgi:hypothetical protein
MAPTMKKLLLIPAMLVLLLSACGKGDRQNQPSENKPVAETGKPVPRVAPEGQMGVDILAGEGVTLDFPHTINYDIMDTSRKGTPRHRVLVEVVGGDFDKTIRGFTKSLSDMGYKKTRNKAVNGRVEQIYKQAGRPTYYLLMQPVEIGPRLKHDKAVGSIHIMWNQR